eukprot:CAMPEP_0197939176 /NCGR_PEP_ID=MMETSP1439-20131203/119266_1 /TAXON_ID=66791 /ORGANISM="Gonyaulax spinifera, Strain CCMP409" /LENGTH=237 /DNA_ID=CAMNT_0043562285 /DNA_START=106 /DNA_END=816 /DNA_ORIENTATION=+
MSRQSLPSVGRRSLSSSALRRSTSKVTLRSSSGFARSSGKSSPSGSTSSATSSKTVLPHLVPPAEAGLAGLAEGNDATSEVCAICIDPLGEGGFVFPCGHDHRLHHQCAVHFLSSLLAMPVANNAPGPLSPKAIRGLGCGWKAIGIIEQAFGQATPPTLARICCPLCRGAWPAEEQIPLRTVMSQLREVSAQAQGEKAERLRRALSRVHERFDHGPEVLRARKAKALIVLDLNLHSA